jgi:uncharacterized protein YeaO (DUF488 family)
MGNSEMPPLGQASVFDVRAMAEPDRARLGHLVLVMRKWPQGFSWEALGLHLWLPDAGPSSGLLRALQTKQIDWEEFARRYRAEQQGLSPEAGYYKVGKGEEGRRTSEMSPLQQLHALRVQHGLVTVLCHERQGHCHRHVLVQLASEAERGEPAASAPFRQVAPSHVHGDGGVR